MSGSTNEPRDIRAVYPGSCARALLEPAFLVWRRMSCQSLQNAAVLHRTRESDAQISALQAAVGLAALLAAAPASRKRRGRTSPGAMPRTPASANVSDAVAYGIALDAQGKIAWGVSDIGGEGDPIISAE